MSRTIRNKKRQDIYDYVYLSDIYNCGEDSELSKYVSRYYIIVDSNEEKIERLKKKQSTRDIYLSNAIVIFKITSIEKPTTLMDRYFGVRAVCGKHSLETNVPNSHFGYVKTLKGLMHRKWIVTSNERLVKKYVIDSELNDYRIIRTI